jgi:hypothetical protein
MAIRVYGGDSSGGSEDLPALFITTCVTQIGPLPRGYARAYKLVGPAYNKSGTKQVGWRYTPTCTSYLCGPGSDRIKPKQKGPYLQCGGSVFIFLVPTQAIWCVGLCVGLITPGVCDVSPFPF